MKWGKFPSSLLLVSLLACSLKPDYRDELEKQGIAYTPEKFLESIEGRDVEAVVLFLKAGINPNSTDKEGATGLMKASLHGYQELVKLLLEYGADPNLEDNQGRTALDYASVNPATGVFQILASRGALYGSLEPSGQPDRTSP